MAGIILSIEVDDKGTVKIKQFSDETKKAFDQMKKGPQEAAGSLNSLRDSWVGVTAKIGIATAAFYAAKRMIYDTAKDIASAGNEIERMARNLNMTTDEFQKWTYVAKMADIEVGEFGMAFKFLTQSMSNAIQGEGDANKAFTALGITLKDTTGKTKDQQTVLMETIGALEKYGDGVNRDALMLAIFGRAFISIKPLIDQGTKAIEENKAAAERLSLILGKDVIKSLSESEDSFKKWSMTLNVAKMETLEPLVNILGSMLERIMALKKAWAEGGIKGVYQDILAAQEEERIRTLTGPAWVKEWVAGWTPPIAKKKPEAPGLPPAGKSEVDTIKETMNAIEAVTAAEELRGQVFLAQRELVELGWVKEKDIVEQVREELANLEREANEWGEITVGRQELVEAGWERAKKQAEEMKKVWTTLSENISSAWNFNVTGILRGTTSIKDAFKNMVDGMVDSFISGITKMIYQWLLFGSVTGKTESSGGFLYGGSWSGILGGILGSLQGGIESVPQTGPYLLHKGESVVPEGKNKGTVVNNYYIQNTTNQVTANDAKSFADLLDRDPNAIIEILRKNARGAGAMKDIIRGANS